MDDEQYWMQRLDEFLAYVGHNATTPDPANVIANLRGVVGRWIKYALERQVHPGERNESLLDKWVTKVLSIEINPQRDYRARVRRWWRWSESQQTPARSATADQDPSERLARLVAEFRADGYSLGDAADHLHARERFEEILRRLPTMPHADRQQLKEVWRPTGEGSYGGVGQIVQLISFIDRATEAEWDTLRQQLAALCFGTDSLADRLQSAVDQVSGLGWTSATRVVAVCDPRRVIPNYSLHNQGRWSGKLDALQLLVDEGLLDADIRHRVERVLQDHPRSKPSGRAVVESNDLLLEILRPHFTDSDSVDTWGMRSLLYWLSERHIERDATGSGPGEIDLSTLVAEFRASTEYPYEDDPQHLQAREQHERVLRSLDEMSYEDRLDIKPVWATRLQNYGWAGQHPSLDRAINNATKASWPQIRDMLADLCFGSGAPRREGSQITSGVRGRGYGDGSCGAADDHGSIWGPSECNCGAGLTYKTIRADRRKLRAEKHCKHSGAFIWQGQPVDRATREVQHDWTPRGEFEDRIDEAVRRVNGLGYVVATKLPAVCHPEDFVPLYLLRSTNDEGQALGKLDMIELLDELALFDADEAIEAREVVRLHEERGDCGAVVMRSNDLLLSALRSHFSADDVVDTWGIARFLYWLAWEYREHEPAVPRVDPTGLESLADELLCDVDMLKDIVELLEDKRQVILYGPPGTGKTYFARHLAWMLTRIQNDEEYGETPPFSLVQFHPAYSYEDFFEGYRPVVDHAGHLTYELTPGPLVRLAERAADNPGELHVMVIDEINRANLPRVLGELLYLLEYRDVWTQTQYRPVDGFVLPSNLWIIGTMNTADRSIALIDAAMRRRFHFVPFFPNRPPTEDLLHRWAQEHAPGQAWVAELLDMVNDELEQALDGDHLLIGPSHFMKPDLDEDKVRRIWTYNIEPLIEDQLFGQHDAIERFRFDRVWRRHSRAADSGQGVHADADEPTGEDQASADDSVAEDEDSGADGTAHSVDGIGDA